MTVLVQTQYYPNMPTGEIPALRAIAKRLETVDLNNMTFANAMELVLKGEKVARHAWNAPGQFITRIMPGNATHLGYPMQPCLGLKNAQNNMQPGWVPSQGDLFATDWYLLERVVD